MPLKEFMKIKILVIVVVILALLGFGGYYLVNKAFNLILESRLGDMEFTDMEEPDEEIGEETPEVMENPADKKQAWSDNAEASSEISQKPQEGHNGTPEGNLTEKTSQETQKTEKKKAPVSGSRYISPKKIKEVEKSVSFQDKAKVLNIVFSRLKPEDVAILKKLAQGGVSGPEMNRARQILKSRITKEEKEVLKDLFYKYDHLLDEDKER